jgi:glycosyltransferase involved in cell wall biosynthesis
VTPTDDPARPIAAEPPPPAETTPPEPGALAEEPAAPPVPAMGDEEPEGVAVRGDGSATTARTKSKKRILTVVDSLRRGGAERLIVTSHAFLDRTRYELAVAALFPPYDLAGELRGLGVKVWTLDTKGTRDLVLALARTYRAVRAFRPHIVHTHLFAANIAGRLAAGGRPVITTLHNPDYGAEDNGSLRFRLRKLIDQRTGNRYNRAFIAVSDSVRDDYLQQMGFGPIHVVPNYVDVGDIARRVEGLDRVHERVMLGLADDDIAVLHVGRFHRQKAQDILLEAFREARQEEPRLRLLLAGDGPELSKARVLAGDLEDRVMFFGDVADPVRLYAAADVFAFPSRWEAFGIALLEAMAAGLPVVATRTGGIPEVLGTEWPELVEPEQVTPLALCLLRLARDKALRRERGDAAKTRAGDFDARPGVQRLAAVYDRI